MKDSTYYEGSAGASGTNGYTGFGCGNSASDCFSDGSCYNDGFACGYCSEDGTGLDHCSGEKYRGEELTSMFTT